MKLPTPMRRWIWMCALVTMVACGGTKTSITSGSGDKSAKNKSAKNKSAKKKSAKKKYRKLVKKARKHKNAKRYDKALKAVERALALRPGSRAYILKSEILMKQGKKDLAVRVATEATTVRPKKATVWFNLGMLHIELDQDEHAKPALRKYLKLRPKGDKADKVRHLLKVM